MEEQELREEGMRSGMEEVHEGQEERMEEVNVGERSVRRVLWDLHHIHKRCTRLKRFWDLVGLREL